MSTLIPHAASTRSGDGAGCEGADTGVTVAVSMVVSAMVSFMGPVLGWVGGPCRRWQRPFLGQVSRTVDACPVLRSAARLPVFIV